jgi:hypothetical protein
MKTNYRIAIAIFLAVTVFIFVDAVNNFSLSSSSGAPAGRTGSPGDGNLTCAVSGCHLPGPTPATMAGWITSNIPASGYVPGNTYTITATATRPNHVRFGFEVSPQSITGTLLGTLIITNTTETQLVGANKYVTHKLAGTTGAGSKTWNFNWTAPVAGTGSVTFYGAFNVANNSGNSSGDTIYKSTLVISECIVPAQPGTITGNVTVCPGSPQSYSITAVAGATSYTWTLPSGWTGTSTTNSINVTAGTTSGNITVTANNSCGASTVRTLAVTANNVAVSISQVNISCFGANNGLLSANPSGGSNPYTFIWSNGASSWAISTLAPGTYTVTVTDAIGCTATASATITQPPLLTSCPSGIDSVCSGSSIPLSCCSSGGTPPYIYSWSPSANLNSSAICNPIAFAVSSTTYTVIISDANGCTASSSQTIIILPLPPTPVISVSADTLFSNVTGPYIYQWYLNGNPVANALLDHYVTSTSGNYTVSVITMDGCTMFSSSFPYFPTGIENAGANTLTVYPNPANGHLFIDVNSQWKNNSVYIFDAPGHLVLKTHVTEGKNQIDISSLEKGIYMLTWQMEKGKFVQRFAIVR